MEEKSRAQTLKHRAHKGRINPAFQTDPDLARQFNVNRSAPLGNHFARLSQRDRLVFYDADWQ